MNIFCALAVLRMGNYALPPTNLKDENNVIFFQDPTPQNLIPDLQGPAPEDEQPHASVQAWGGPAGEQLCGEGPGSAGGQRVDREPAVCPGCQEGQWHSGVH